LSRPARRAIEDQRSELWLSSVSVWEVIRLAEKRRLGSVRDPFSWIEDASAKLFVRDAPLTRAIALEAGRFRMSHNDPSDYLIVATARVLQLTLVTADQSIIQSKAVRIIEAA
jgi:PIN domain nuclease of toxin-antitoxin system